MERSELRIVNPIDVSEASPWLRSMFGVFLSDPDGPKVERWAQVMGRVWEPERAWGVSDRGRWVATLRTEARTLRVPGADGTTRELRVDAVSSVTVSATHRRRGLLSRMLGASLEAAQARGDAVSILVAAEWPIYGRFGYAPATWCADYVLHRRRTGAVARGDGGLVRGSDVAEIAAVADSVFTTFSRRRAGQVSRGQQWWDIALGREGFPPPAADAGLPHHWIVHEGDDGVDGVLGWRATAPSGGQDPARVTVWGVMAANDRAEQNLWAYLAGIDLVDEIVIPRRPVDEPARWWLADGRSLVSTDYSDFLWLRLIDVPAALTARAYPIDSEIVLDVRDDAPTASLDLSGRYALTTRGASAECSATSRPADLELTQRALASIYLGGVRPAELVPTGAVTELTPGALERARLLFSVAQAPWNATGF